MDKLVCPCYPMLVQACILKQNVLVQSVRWNQHGLLIIVMDVMYIPLILSKINNNEQEQFTS